MQDFILLEDCSPELKLWYLLVIRNFIVESDDYQNSDLPDELEEDESSEDELDLEEDESSDDDVYSGHLSGRNVVYLLRLGIQIKYHFSVDDVIRLMDSSIAWDQKLEELESDPDVAKFIEAHRSMIDMSLLKDMLQINFEAMGFSPKFLGDDCWDRYYEFINSKDYFDERHMLVDENPVLLEFIEDSGLSLEFARFFEGGYRLFMTYLKEEGSNKDLMEIMKSFDTIFLEKVENEFSNSLYFSGTPYGIPAKDFLAMLSKTFKLVGRVKTAVSTATAIATLSNPFTCALGLASLGIAAVSYLSKNDNLEKTSLRRAFLSGLIENYHQVKLLVLNILEDYNSELLSSNEMEESEVLPVFSVNLEMCTALQTINEEESDLMSIYLACELPPELDVKRLDACLRQFDNSESTRNFVMKMYSDIDGDYVLSTGLLLSDLIRLKNVFDSIGYFTMTGYLKQFV